MPIAFRRAAALFLLAHGVAHLVGFVGSWRLADLKDVAYSTRVLNGALDVGDVGVQLIGLLWLIAAAGFVWASVTVWLGSVRSVLPVTVFSLAVCLVGLPAAIVGVALDLAILVTYAALTVARPERRRLVFR